MIIEDVGNGAYNDHIEIDGNIIHFHFSIFNNALGQVCDVYADARKCRLDHNLQVIESNMPPSWVERAKVSIVKLLSK